MSVDRRSRQGFLGDHAEEVLGLVRVGVVGLGGGGSHIAQQLAHVGVRDFVLYDADEIEETNLNRLVGGTDEDVAHGRQKVDIAKRTIRGIAPKANVEAIPSTWQENDGPLKTCDLVFGCVDGFAQRQQLESCARRYLIPYVDIGVDVHQEGDEPPRMAGQILLSMPGAACFTCMGFLAAAKLADEAARYGAAGVRPQVVWANGVLASTAVGIGIELLTDWTRARRGPVYLSYDANTGLVVPHPRVVEVDLPAHCEHYPLTDVGPPSFSAL